LTYDKYSKTPLSPPWERVRERGTKR